MFGLSIAVAERWNYNIGSKGSLVSPCDFLTGVHIQSLEMR